MFHDYGYDFIFHYLEKNVNLSITLNEDDLLYIFIYMISFWRIYFK